MNNLLTSTQMREADAYTIEHQGITSMALIERAAEAFVKVFKKNYTDHKKSISILCGQGNNGGDGLAIARLLHVEKYKNISIYLICFGSKESRGFVENLERLKKTNLKPIVITEPDQFENVNTDIIIDAILGSGLNKPLAGKYAILASNVDHLGATVIAVDVPSGLPSEGLIDKNYKGIRADLVVCFQRPKINFFFPDSTIALTSFVVADIGLDEKFIQQQACEWKLITKPHINLRKNFSHKGTYGHALIVAGNSSTMGAALLAAKGCLRVGAGLTTLCIPNVGFTALNTYLPEVMALPRSGHLVLEAFDKFDSIALGPGLGTEEENAMLLANLIKMKKPMVIDADALNILAKQRDLLDKLPEQTILTPHLKEFDRLFGEHETWWERVATAKNQAKERKLIIVLKNQYTFVCVPSGEVHINQTGNPAMASGGMGDVLTGIIAGLLAQSYSSADAARIAVYLHGKAGDYLAKKRFAVSASQVADEIPKTIKKLIE